MKIVLLLAVVAFAAAQDAPSAAAEQKNYTPQEKFLARQNVANFACKVNAVEVIMEESGDEDKIAVTAEDLENALSQTASLEWAHVNQMFFSSLDGRSEEKILGTGGGDMGEFIQALEAYTKITGVQLTAEEVSEAFARYLKIMSRDKFFFETDEKAYRKLAIATGCQNLKIAAVGEKRKKQAILDQYASDDMADFIGDPYIKFLATNADELELHKDYVTFAIQAYHKALWKNNADSDKLCYTMLSGRNHPSALVHIATPGYCVDQGLAPLISSQVLAAQIYVEHTDPVKLFRRELVQLLSKPGDNPQDILAQFNTFAKANLSKFWEQYTGFPSFTVRFSYLEENSRV